MTLLLFTSLYWNALYVTCIIIRNLTYPYSILFEFTYFDLIMFVINILLFIFMFYEDSFSTLCICVISRAEQHHLTTHDKCTQFLSYSFLRTLVFFCFILYRLFVCLLSCSYLSCVWQPIVIHRIKSPTQISTFLILPFQSQQNVHTYIPDGVVRVGASNLRSAAAAITRHLISLTTLSEQSKCVETFLKGANCNHYHSYLMSWNSNDFNLYVPLKSILFLAV